MPCPEVFTVSYIRPAEVLTLFSVEGDTQVKQKKTAVGFLTVRVAEHAATHTTADLWHTSMMA